MARVGRRVVRVGASIARLWVYGYMANKGRARRRTEMDGGDDDDAGGGSMHMSSPPAGPPLTAAEVRCSARLISRSRVGLWGCFLERDPSLITHSYSIMISNNPKHDHIPLTIKNLNNFQQLIDIQLT